MIANMVAIRQGSIGHIRYMLKDSLKYLPFYGAYFRQVSRRHSCVMLLIFAQHIFYCISYCVADHLRL